jgi:hypothetical protein
MKTINKFQLICIKTLINKLNLRDKSKVLVSGFSEGRSESTVDLTNDEANPLIKHLKSLDPEEVAAEKMRKKIIALCHEMSWTIVEHGKRKADMKRIDNFCIKSGYLKKKLNQYLYSELPTLVTQFEAIHKSFLNGLKMY